MDQAGKPDRVNQETPFGMELSKGVLERILAPYDDWARTTHMREAHVEGIKLPTPEGFV